MEIQSYFNNQMLPELDPLMFSHEKNEPTGDTALPTRETTMREVPSLIHPVWLL